jgi:DNA-binding MarR family transcriptional regulator
MSANGKRMRKDHKELLTELGAELSALLVASRAVMTASAKRFHPTLQPAAYQLAIALSVHGSLKSGQLAELLDMDKSAISRLAKSLCENGLAQQRIDPEDGRGIVYDLTDEGWSRIQASRAVKSDAFFSRMETWTDTELLQFITLLRKFNQG